MAKTYYFSFTEDAKLVVVQSDMPEEDAIHKTGNTIKMFGWVSGIERTLYEIGQYLMNWKHDEKALRVRLNSKPVTMPDGTVFEGCASCGYSAQAEKAFWTQMVVALRTELENPPDLEAKPEVKK